MRVCVTGAGVAGLVTAKVLGQDGFEVTVFEKERSIGGVWAPSRAYSGLRTNNPRETYAFSDFPYPETADEFPTASQVCDYLEAYAEHYDVRSRVRLSTEVVSVSRAPASDDGAGAGFRVAIRPTNAVDRPEAAHGADAADELAFDRVVVCNGVFSEPWVPRLPGEDRFEGRRLHSSQAVDPEVFRDRRVVVVGAGKSALDCATAAGDVAQSCTLVFRKPHWMLPRYFFSRLRVDHVVFTRFSEWLLPPYHWSTPLRTARRWLGAPLIWAWRKGLSALVPRLTGMPPSMVPETPITSGAQNIGIGDKLYRAVERGDVTPIRSGIGRFAGARQLELSTGETVAADVVVFATGWKQDVPFLADELQREVRRDGRFHLYRHILPPREPRLGFVGYASSANSPLTAEVAAHWLSDCFRGDLPLPDPAEMDAEIDRVREWAAATLPGRDQGYFVGGYVSQYIDELMRDMGLRSRRSGHLHEYLGPIWADRYRGLAEERRRRRTA